MTTHSNKANANDCKEEAVICKKNRLYDLPSDLENYIYSFVEDSLHKASHKKLFIDNTFIKLMWKKYNWTSSDFYYNYFRKGMLQKRFMPIMTTNKCYEEIEIEYKIENQYKNGMKTLPSDIHIEYFVDDDTVGHICVNGKKWEIYREERAFDELFKHFRNKPETYLKIAPFYIKMFQKDEKWKEADIKKLQEEKNVKEIVSNIYLYNLMGALYESYRDGGEEIGNEIFGEMPLTLYGMNSGFMVEV